MSNPTTYGYLERPYLSDPYMAGYALMAYGMQVTMVIASSSTTGVQVKAQAAGAKSTGVQVKAQAAGKKPLGMQTLTVAQGTPATGLQVKRQIAATKATALQVKAQTSTVKPTAVQVKAQAASLLAAAMQVKAQTAALGARGVQVKLITSALKTTAFQVYAIAQGGKAVAYQVKGQVIGARSGYGVQLKTSPSTFGLIAAQAKRGNFAHWDVNGYLVAPYLTGDYLVDQVIAQGGMQVGQTITPKNSLGTQVLSRINTKSASGFQTTLVINSKNAQGIQVLQRLAKSRAFGVQVRGLIKKAQALGFQVYPYISVKMPIGVQVTAVEGKLIGMQVTVVLYNDTNLRVLSSFPSRGNGSNWTASSTAAGDFSANNLNTDIVEQQWRSAPGTTVGVTLDCDTGVSSVFVDTVAIFNHNFSTSAQVTLQGSAFADQHVVAVSIPLVVTKGNIIWVSPVLPNVGVRYWRFIINDPTNTQGQLRAGTIVFGSAMIFENDNITATVKKTRVHFADKVATEGFTDVMNDRALKTQIEINFDNLKYEGGNFQALDNLFQTVRTSLKALWIPDPQVPTRFGVFGKLPVIPSENHNNLGVDRDYVQLTINVDESL